MLDITANYQLINKIARKHFRQYPIEGEDLVQEVCLRIHKLNLGKVPYDPSKSSESSYIYMVMKSCAINQVQKRKKTPTSTLLQDAPKQSELCLIKELIEQFRSNDATIDSLLPYILSGCSRREIRKTTGLSEYSIRQNIEIFKAMAEDLRT